MTRIPDDDYSDLADAAERGDLKPIPGTKRTGTEAAEHGRALLLQATGADTLDEATRLALGRPRAGSTRKTGPSPVLRTRVDPGVAEAVTILANHEGQSVSELLREIITRDLTRRAHNAGAQTLPEYTHILHTTP